MLVNSPTTLSFFLTITLFHAFTHKYILSHTFSRKHTFRKILEQEEAARQQELITRKNRGEIMDKTCQFGDCNEIALFQCSKCTKAFYCSRHHQTQHWQYHQSLCKQVGRRKEDYLMTHFVIYPHDPFSDTLFNPPITLFNPSITIIPSFRFRWSFILAPCPIAK